MINKSNLWFLTLSSIILVLAIYYIGGPIEETDMVFSATTSNTDNITVIEESETLTAMRVTKEENVQEEMQVLQEVLLNSSSTLDQKNDAYEQIKMLNNKKSLEEKLESLINKEFTVSSFVEIEEDKLKVVIANKEDSYKLANEIIQLVNKNVDEYYYVTVKFE